MNKAVPSRFQSGTSRASLSFDLADDKLGIILNLFDRDKPLFWLAKYQILDVVSLREMLVPPKGPSYGSVPIGFAFFSYKDPRPYVIAYRMDCTATYMNESTLLKFSQTWINIVHSVFVIYTNSSRTSRDRNQNWRIAILTDVDRYDFFNIGKRQAAHDDEIVSKLNIVSKNAAETRDVQNWLQHPGLSISDLQIGVGGMLFHFPESAHPGSRQKRRLQFVSSPSPNK